MRNKFALCLIAILIFTARAPVSGQEPLTLERTRELALLNSRSLARYNLVIQGNLLNERTQSYNMLPSISLGVSASTSLWTKDGYPENLIKNSFSSGASFSISQRIWDGGKNAILRAINSLATEMSRQDALAEYYSVLSSADTAYYSVLEAAAALEAAESSLSTASLSLEMAEIRRMNGMINDALYLQALSEMANREVARNQSRRDLALANLRFRELLGIDFTPVLEPIDMDSLEDLIILLANLDDREIDRLFIAIRNETHTRNPSIVKAALSSERSERNVSLATRDYSPTLSASLSTGINYTINNGFEPSGGRLSLSASIPLDFWVISANVQKQRTAQEQTALDFRNASSSHDIELSVMILDLISQAGQIISTRRAVDYAQRHFDQVLELYRLARYSPSELSDAETMVRNSRNQHNRARYSFLTSLSKIRNAGVFDSDEDVIELIYSVVGVR